MSALAVAVLFFSCMHYCLYVVHYFYSNFDFFLPLDFASDLIKVRSAAGAGTINAAAAAVVVRLSPCISLGV